MNTRVITLLFVAACLPVAAGADSFDYNYLGLAYVHANTEFTAGAGNGYRLDGSWSIGGNGFSLEGGYRYQRFDRISLDPVGGALEAQNIRLGIGYHRSLGNTVDFVAHANYVRARTSNDQQILYSSITNNQTNNAYVFGVGIRGHVSENFELYAGVDHDDAGLRQYHKSCTPYGCNFDFGYLQDTSENVVAAGARYRFSRSFGLALGYEHSELENRKEWLLSARWNF